jgi:lambda family phage tail tape measure protein
MTNFVGRLGVTLGLDSAEFSRGIDGAINKLDKFASQAKNYMPIVAASFAAATTAALQYADELADVAKANDVAISSVIQLRNALASSGGEAGNASKFLSSFTQYIDKAAEGSFEAQKALKSMGISLEDIKTLSIDQLFRRAAQGLSEMDDAVTRNAKGMELFGKASKGVDLVGFNNELNKVSKLSADHEKGIKAAAEAYDLLAERSRNSMQTLAALVGPTIKSAIEWFDKLTAAIKKSGDEYLETAKKYEKLLAILPGARLLAVGLPQPGSKGPVSEADMEAQAAMMANIGGNPQRRIGVAGINKDAEAAAKKEQETRIRVMRLREQDKQRQIKEAEELYEYQRKGREAEEEAEKKRQKQLQDAEFAKQEQRDGDLRAQFELDDLRQKADIDLQNRQAQEMKSIDRQKIMLDLADKGLLMKAREYQFAQEILQAQFRYQDAAKQIREDQTLTDAAKEAAMIRLKNLTEAEFDLAKQRLALAEKMQNETFAKGFLTAMIQSAQNATSAFDYGRQAFDSMIGSMSNALTQFVRTGKLSFKDLARSIISDLIAIQLRAQATALFSRLIGGMMTGPTVGPGMAAQALPSSFNQFLAARAEGGPVSGGSPYLVGERGPELFVPNRSGAIVPTNQLAGVMGGGQTINYNGPFIQQMSAIDTQSGVQFLAQNKQAIWAANQSAQRSLPVSR